jgi:hypothetical protein
MYLKNDISNHKICNGTIGIVTDIDLDKLEIRVAFSVIGRIVV